MDHSWPPWKQQQPAGPHHSPGARDPSQRDPSCLLALGHRARETWCFTPLLRQTSSWPARPAGKQPCTRRERSSASSALPQALAVLQGKKTGTSQGPAQGLSLVHQVVSIILDGDPQPPWAGPPSQEGVLQREEKPRGLKCFTSPQKEQWRQKGTICQLILYLQGNQIQNNCGSLQGRENLSDKHQGEEQHQPKPPQLWCSKPAEKSPSSWAPLDRDVWQLRKAPSAQGV